MRASGGTGGRSSHIISLTELLDRRCCPRGPLRPLQGGGDS